MSKPLEHPPAVEEGDDSANDPNDVKVTTEQELKDVDDHGDEDVDYDE